jgi:shikimate dehydrogenase
MKNIRSIGTSTRICAIIGNPVAHSLSPAIHNAGFAALGLDFVYVAFRVEDVRRALDGMRALENFRGMSVTIPHKLEAMKYVDDVALVDRHIGSINTITNENGRLSGFGTDGPGALKAFRDAGATVAGKNVLMLGGGGAARAIAFTLARDAGPLEINILDIDGPTVDRLAADLISGTETTVRSGVMTDKALSDAMAKVDIIIHCTPVGMHPKENISLVPKNLFRSGQVVFDAVYNPLETRLLAEAKACGLKVISGVEMFINQAVLQFERFTGVPAPEEIMRRVVMAHLTS